MTVSLRLPDDVKRRIAKLAQQRDTSAHAFMVDAIREKVDAEEARAAFHAEGERRLARMKRARTGIPAGEVFGYLARRLAGRPAKRPKARRVA
jgi:predicted DNA-binding protein